jgi:hypothetical protein
MDSLEFNFLVFFWDRFTGKKTPTGSRQILKAIRVWAEDKLAV